MKNLDLTFDFPSKKNQNKIKKNPNKSMIPNEILSKKIKLKVDLPSPPRVVREEMAYGGCRGPSLSTKGPHTDACPLWDPPLSTKDSSFPLRDNVLMLVLSTMPWPGSWIQNLEG